MTSKKGRKNLLEDIEDFIMFLMKEGYDNEWVKEEIITMLNDEEHIKVLGVRVSKEREAFYKKYPALKLIKKEKELDGK